jgi:hypothetical protein
MHSLIYPLISSLTDPLVHTRPYFLTHSITYLRTCAHIHHILHILTLLPIHSRTQLLAAFTDSLFHSLHYSTSAVPTDTLSYTLHHTALAALTDSHSDTLHFSPSVALTHSPDVYALSSHYTPRVYELHEG